MSYQNISKTLTVTDKAEIEAAILILKLKLPFLISLNAAERKQLRKMGAVRTSYVQDVYQATVNNLGAIPTGLNVAEYGKDLQLFRDLSDIYSKLLPLLEGIESTEIAVGNELMKQTDECYGHLKVAAKKSTNLSLGQTVKKIADQLKQNPKTTPAT